MHRVFVLSSFLVFCSLNTGCQTPESTPTPGATPSPSPSTSPTPTPSTTPAPASIDLSVRPDGWAGSSGAPSSPGGYGAPASRTYTVANRTELINALRVGGSAVSDLSKVIYVSGMIDLCSDSSGKSLEATDFLTQAGYNYASYQAYQNAYMAACTATTVGTEMANTQKAAAAKQKAVVQISVGSNTTLYGLGANSGFKNGSLSLSGKTNIVLRNLAILDSYDYFPAWDPSEDMVNSAYDTISITSGSTYIWIDHCRVGDGDRSDSTLPWYSVAGVSGTREWVTHDGLIDVTNGANYVTISWNKVEDHNKTMLFGSSDSSTGDSGKLKVTVHHNWFTGVTQRLPRVRFGQVHLYNNYYEAIGSYAVGVGDNARIYSEANDFTGTSHAFDKYDDTTNEGYFFDVGSLNVGGTETMATATQVGWLPSTVYSYSVAPVAGVKASVTSGAGVGKL